MLFEFNHQRSNAEVTVVQKPNQGVRKKRAVYRFFLELLVLFFQEKSTEKKYLLLKKQKVRITK